MSAIGRRIDRAEAAVAPVVAPMIVYEAGDHIPEAELEAFERDVLKPHPSQVVVIRRFESAEVLLMSPRPLPPWKGAN